ncbi:MAG: RluA family pseudouridine synthase [Solirubrobacterales bacterium]|nr:RluA family pseudouridine synthase [Solirubrobacterales bacterium]
MSAEAPISLRVPDVAAGTRLDRFLASPLGSRARAQALIDAGRVRVDGALVPKRHLVRTGEAIEIDDSSAEGVGVGDEAEAPFEVAYEDEHLLVVDKPAGVVVHPARGHWAGTLAQALEGRAAGGGEPWRAGIVHRLDRDTSGLLVVAKNDAVHRALKSLLAARRLRREYVALVEGHPPARTGTIDAPIGRHRRDRKLMSIDSAEPREARTHFEIERLLPEAALLRVVLDTGRTHQIRVHLAAIGHPVAGDPQYGAAGRFGLTRQFLHATRLAFPHPVTGAEIDTHSELPEDLRKALSAAEQGT